MSPERREYDQVMVRLHELAARERFSTEEDAQFEALVTRAEALKSRISTVPSASLRFRPQQALEEAAANLRFEKFLRGGWAAVDERAFAVGTGNVGGYTAPAAFIDKLEIAVKSWSSMLNNSTIELTDNGSAAPYPTMNYTSVSAAITAENAAGSLDSSTPFGSVTLNAFTYRSKIIPVSWELLQDSMFDVERYIARAAAKESIGRGFNAHATTGTGTGQPQGIITAAASGKVGTTGQTSTVIYDDLADLVHSIDEGYLEPDPETGRRPQWLMRGATFGVVRKLKDSAGNPLVPAAVNENGRPTLLGYEVVLNPDVVAMAANAKSIAFGRLDKYVVRRVARPIVLRSEERYADSGQVAFQVAERLDGRLIDAGTNPVKYYQNSAT